MKSFLRSVSLFLGQLWSLLTDPFESLSKSEDRRRAKITTTLIFFSFIFVGIEQVVAGSTPFVILLVLAISYIVARTRHYKIATMALLLALSFPSFSVALNIPNPDPNRILTAFAWIVLPLILSGLIHSVRATLIYSVLNILLISSLPLLRSDMSFSKLGATLGFYILATTFIVTAMVQRDKIERDRQAELIESRNQLKEEAGKRKQFAEQAQRRADQLLLLNEVGQTISNLQGLNEILEVIFEQVRRVIPLDVFFVALYDEKTDMVSFPFMFDNGSRWNEQSRPLSKTLFVARVVQTGRSYLMDLSDEELEAAKGAPSRIGDRSRNTSSGLMAPLQIGSRVIGMITAQSYERHAYNEDQLSTLTTLAHQVTIAIENARLFEQTTKRAQRLSMLNDIGREISMLTDLPTLMETVYHQVNRALSTDLFFIGLYDKEKNKLSFPIMYDEGRAWRQHPTQVTEGTFSGKTILTKKPLLVNEWSGVAEDSGTTLIVGDESNITKSLMFAPMLFGTETIGVISVQSYKVNAYNEEDLDLLSGIGNQVAIAIQNTRLLEETKKNEGYFATLNELGRVVSELRDLPSLLEIIYQEVKKHLNVDSFFVNIYDSKTGLFTVPIAYDSGVRYQAGAQALTSKTFLHDFLQGVSAVLILRTEDDLKRPIIEEEMFGDETRRSASLMAAPIKVGEQMIGAISVQSYTQNAYTIDDLNLLVGIGNQAGIAIQNARLLEEIKQNAKHLSILNEVGSAVAKIMDLPDLLEVIYEQGRKSISLDAFFVGLYHPETNEVSFPITFDNGKRYESPPGQVTKASYLNRFLNGERSILINRTEEQLAEGVKNQMTMGDKARLSASIMAVPLISRDQVIGMMSAQSYTMNAFNATDVKLLEGIANQVSIAIENSRLYSSAQQEIKERQRVEMELQKERDFAVQIMNTLGQGVSVSMMDGVYEYVNPAYAKMLGYRPEDMIGEPSEFFAMPEDTGIHSEQRKHRQEGEATTYETRLKHKDGHIIHALVTGVPRYANGRIIGSIAAITDLTERKKAEIDRENLIVEMDAKNAELERFTYTVSHDLKSPLVTIAGFLGFLEEDVQKRKFERLPRTISRIREAAKRMQRLLDELLELSRIGRIANPSQYIPFGELVKETLELVEGQLREMQVEVEVDAEFPIVHVDRVRMLEVIQNLVTNAVKFMGNQNKPMIHIGVENRNGENCFFVKDNGIGIAPEFHDRIFGLFNKLDPYTEGTGIGLALVKRIVEVHGGRIWVESEPGRGATFFFTLENKSKEETV